MIRTLPLILLAGTALAACEPQTIDGRRDDPAANTANTAAVELPPAIAASKTYRCKDNSLVRIDWLSDNSAYIHGDGQTQTRVKTAPPTEGQPASTDLVGEGGYVLKGEASASSINVTLPGKPAQSCHV